MKERKFKLFHAKMAKIENFTSVQIKPEFERIENLKKQHLSSLNDR